MSEKMEPKAAEISSQWGRATAKCRYLALDAKVA